MTQTVGGAGEAKTISVDITNPADSGTVALAIRPKLLKAGSDQQVLPVHMSDGYFSLIPGESKDVTLEFDPRNAGDGEPKLVLDCWNNAGGAR